MQGKCVDDIICVLDFSQITNITNQLEDSFFPVIYTQFNVTKADSAIIIEFQPESEDGNFVIMFDYEHQPIPVGRTQNTTDETYEKVFQLYPKDKLADNIEIINGKMKLPHGNDIVKKC